MAARSITTARRSSTGFTLIELVMVIVIIGTLAAVALPKLLDMTSWRLRAYSDNLRAQAMAMQRLALAQRRPVVATITPAGVRFTYQAGGAVIVNLACPAAVSPCIAEPGSRTVTFNAANSGRAVTSSGAALPVTVSGAGMSNAYLIESETGVFRTAP